MGRAVNHLDTPQYNRDLDRWIVAAVHSGVESFWQLVSALPGVYPTVVRKAARRLVEESRIPSYVMVEDPTSVSDGDSELEIPGLPIPHPLSSDWRFTRRTAGELLERIINSTDPASDVALIGAPSVFFLATLEEVPQRFTLLDENYLLADRVHWSPNKDFLRCDVTRDIVDIPLVQTVIADPPWYKDDVLGFLQTSVRVCEDQGMVFLGFGSNGTRPGISEERRQIIAAADQMGLRLTGIEHQALSYSTPFFEYNALKAANFKHVPAAWRHGDLIVFQKDGSADLAEDSHTASEHPWTEVHIDGVRVRVRRDVRPYFVDPRLLQLVPGHILPTVSRRDAIGKAADVWTTGNRIYLCDGKNILKLILHALRIGESARDAVERYLPSKLSHVQSRLISETVTQIRGIIETERQEFRSFSNGFR